MRRIVLSLSSFLLIAAAGCGAEPEVIVTPSATAAAKAPNDKAEAEATAPAEEAEATAPAKEAAGERANDIHCMPNQPDPGCEPPPAPGPGGGRIGTGPIIIPPPVQLP